MSDDYSVVKLAAAMVEKSVDVKAAKKADLSGTMLAVSTADSLDFSLVRTTVDETVVAMVGRLVV